MFLKLHGSHAYFLHSYALQIYRIDSEDLKYSAWVMWTAFDAFMKLFLIDIFYIVPIHFLLYEREQH